MINLFTLRKALQYYWDAETRFQVHSPFVASFIEQVVRNNKKHYGIQDIQLFTDQLKKDQTLVAHTDYGAGSRFKTKEKTIASFAKTSSSDIQKGRWLFHLSRHFKPANVLELGTNLGIGTAYLSKGHQAAKLVSIEGCPNLAKEASQVLSRLKCSNVEIQVGQFKDAIGPSCQKLGKIDLAFIDGNHTYEGTMENYHLIKPYIHEKSVLVFDDIYWSEGMLQSWKELKASDEVVCSVDLFQIGLLFYDPAIQKDELKLIPFRYKPWKLGIVQ